MQNNLKHSCKECPFKKTSLKGWLGGLGAKETKDLVLSEADFACHMTRDKPVSEMSRCKGSQIFFINHCKLPKFNTDLVEAIEQTKKENHDKSEYLGFDFVKHHTIE